MIKVLFFGDISGEPGRKAVKKALPEIMDSAKPDLVFANVDNLAHGKGITVKTIEELIRAGVMGFTSGNHGFSKKQLSTDAFEKYVDLIARPANIPDTYPGKSMARFETPKGTVLLGHFLGQVFMENQFAEPVDTPFGMVDRWLAEHKTEDVKVTIIDFHAEATSEKKAFGYYLDGKVSSVLGTHTHVPTADARVLPGGTAYITDMGMCGAAGTVLGVKKELSLERFLTGNRVAFDIPDNATQAELSYVMVEVDESSGQATNIESVHKIIDI